jgi:folate-binding protein YgfZ
MGDHTSPEGFRAAVESAAFFDLSDRGKVEATGPEAAAFLHNLCTNDIKGLAPGAGCEAFFTNLKARVLAHGFVTRLASEVPTFWIDVGAGQGAALFKHLDRHLISERVELTDRTHEHTELHLCGPSARAVVEKALGAVSDLAELGHEQRPLAGGAVHLRRHGLLNLPGYDLLAPAGDAEALRQALAAAGAAQGWAEALEALRVEAGFPLYGPDMDENRFVVEIGRISQAISYAKGCYLGQEPIVMARDRGHVNRALLGLAFADGGPAPHGAKVFRGADEVGLVTSSVVSPRLGKAVALAYLRRGHQEPGTAVEVEAEGGRRAAVVSALPFAVG